MTIIAVVVVAVIVVASIGYLGFFSSSSSGKTTATTLSESGSTLLYPVFNAWAGNYTSAKITTLASGSGAGISAAIAGTVNMGASDAFMSNALVSAHPNMLNIPILISSQYVTYNLPSLNNVHLTLSGPVLVGIYNNTIQYWNAIQIQTLNPYVNLPDSRIVPVIRSDSSGDTNMFTLFLSRSDSWWNNTVGHGTTVNWPTNPAEQGATGNAGILSFMKSTPDTIGYIAMTYTNQIKAAGLGYAGLINSDDNVVLPSVANVTYAADQYLNVIPADGRIAIDFAPGASSYPIATFEYVIVKSNQTSQALANALKDFLDWVVSTSGGSSNTYMSQFYLVPLPQSVVTQVVTPLINKITG
jgi:phosphate transport system substrate-binding protein